MGFNGQFCIAKISSRACLWGSKPEFLPKALMSASTSTGHAVACSHCGAHAVTGSIRYAVTRPKRLGKCTGHA